MNTSSTADVRMTLLADRERLRTAVDRVPSSIREQKPAPDRWSVAEVLEHLALVEGRVVMMLGQVIQAAPSVDAASRAGATTLDRTALRDRGTRIEAPGPIRPTGTVSADAAWTSLQHSRAQLLALLDTVDVERRDLAQVSRPHPVLGTLDGYQWIAAVGGHEERHSLQILEIAETLERGLAS
jgi:hypothetical protein